MGKWIVEMVKKRVILLSVLILVSSLMFIKVSLAKGPLDTPPPTYICYRASTPVVIDGELTEKFWKDTPRMLFRGLADGSSAWFDCYSQMVWDDKYFYIGFWASEPDVVASVGKDAPEPRQKSEWKLTIMEHDPLFMVFIDPDGDGRNYIEIHINAFNRVYDVWLGQGSTSRERQILSVEEDNYHMEWDCPGIRHGVYIYGTLNNSSDTDVGWSAEIAVPWEALKKFTKGSCPPKPTDVWCTHTGWECRPLGINKPRIYWTWPVIGIFCDHQLWRYGKLLFSDKLVGSREY